MWKEKDEEQKGGRRRKGMRKAEHASGPGSYSACGVTDLSLQQGDLVGEQLDNVLLSKGGGKQEAERGAGGGEQAGQSQTLPRPEYGTS